MIFEIVCIVFVVVWILYKTYSKSSVNYLQVSEPDLKLFHSKIDALADCYDFPESSPLSFDPSSIKYIETDSQFFSALQCLLTQSHIGVDIEESRQFSYKGFICLIQISTQTSTYLFDALKIRGLVPNLSQIFSNEKIVKVFHGAHNDTQWLQRDFGIICVNVFDTQLSGKILGFKRLGLNYLWKKFCGYIMTDAYKKKMQTSRWDLRPLSQEQIVYAALDSFYLIGLMKILMEKLNEQQIKEMRLTTNKICKQRFSDEITEEKILKIFKKNSIQAINTQSKFIFFEIFKLRNEIAKNMNKGSNSICPIEDLTKIALEKPKNIESLLQLSSTNPLISKHSQKILQIITDSEAIEFEILQDSCIQKSRKEKKQERYKTFLEKYTIKKKVYENCQIQAPDGEILCFADSKKANWYLERNLAVVVQNDPLIIRLNFEPNGRGFSDVEADQIYYSKEKKNECVSCGNTSTYLKYHVVPLLYRQYFPENYKNHRSHDVVLLCANCHEIANKNSDVFKKQIAKEFDVPLNSFGELYNKMEEIKGMKKMCLSLKKNWENIPENRKNELISKVTEFLQNNQQYSEYFTDKNIEKTIEFLGKEENCRKLLSVYGKINWKKELGNNHGKIVVEKLSDLKGFIRRWRVHFIESLSPRYLPDSWNVDHLLNSPKFK